MWNKETIAVGLPNDNGNKEHKKWTGIQKEFKVG